MEEDAFSSEATGQQQWYNDKNTFRYRPRKGQITRETPARQHRIPPPQQPHIEHPDLAPRHLSKEFTPPQNDPGFIKESLVDGLSGFRFFRETLGFSIDAAGYANIVETCYDEITTVTPKFNKLITRASFHYYANLCFWYKLACIDAAHGDRPSVFQRLELQFKSLPLPRPIYNYLASVGDITDPNSRNWQLDVPHHLEDRNGDFGPITNENFVMYLAFPSMRICEQSVVQEVQAALHPEQAYEPWAIEDLMPPFAQSFSANCAGYIIPGVCRREALDALRLLGFPNNFNRINISGLTVIPDLISHVKEQLLNLQHYDVAPNTPLNVKGSIVQTAFTTLDSPITNVTRVGLIERDIHISSAHQLPAQAANAAGIFNYRVNRTPRADGFPVIFVPDPPPWNNFNILFTLGNADRWNIDDFRTNRVIAKEVASRYSALFKK